MGSLAWIHLRTQFFLRTRSGSSGQRLVYVLKWDSAHIWRLKARQGRRREGGIGVERQQRKWDESVPVFRFSPPPPSLRPALQLFKCQNNHENFRDLKEETQYCKEKEKKDREGKKWDDQCQLSAFLLRQSPPSSRNFSNVKKIMKISDIPKRDKILQGKGKKGSRRKKWDEPVPAFRFSPPPPSLRPAPCNFSQMSKLSWLR